mmetsp:Transcript_18741/g.32798  ORF Transcript_18741/g.32798 Transcript_18741/m.32798 type:complete len:84 (-) Transcript_18741:871-1122(-)
MIIDVIKAKRLHYFTRPWVWGQWHRSGKSNRPLEDLLEEKSRLKTRTGFVVRHSFRSQKEKVYVLQEDKDAQPSSPPSKKQEE